MSTSKADHDCSTRYRSSVDCTVQVWLVVDVPLVCPTYYLSKKCLQLMLFAGKAKTENKSKRGEQRYLRPCVLVSGTCTFDEVASMEIRVARPHAWKPINVLNCQNHVPVRTMLKYAFDIMSWDFEPGNRKSKRICPHLQADLQPSSSPSPLTGEIHPTDSAFGRYLQALSLSELPSSAFQR